MMRASRRHVLRSTGMTVAAALVPGLVQRPVAASHSATPSASPAGVARTRFHDDFRNGFLIDGADAKWGHFVIPGADGSPAFTGDDGIVTADEEGLDVVSSGQHPDTGEPAFTSSVPQERGNASAVPSGVDHVKWLVYANAMSSAGFPGFDAVPGEELVFRARLSGQTFGSAGHPFGSSVNNPEDDLRLAAVALNTYDPESWMVYDFWLTNTGIYAFYERLPFGRANLGNYAAFSFQIKVGERMPDDWHDLEIAYDRSAGTVRWSVDGEERFMVDRIGYHIDRQSMTLDHGGAEEAIEARQLNGGMGSLTLLDGSLPSGEALVRLSDVDGTYFDPIEGEPVEQVFVDDESNEANRLFGQGARLRMDSFTVETRPSGD